jgi:mono/diheme cytochrome c family protein
MIKEMRLFAAALLFFWFALPFTAAASSRSERRARGAADFQSTGCDHCHSIRGSGGHRGPDLSGVGRRKNASALRKQIIYGSKTMPAFGDILSSQEIDDLVAYLRSCKDKTASAPAQ